MRAISKLRIILVAGVWLALTSVRLQPAQAVGYVYELVDLGPFPRHQSSGAMDVNEAGQASGYSGAYTGATCVSVAVRWSPTGSPQALVPSSTTTTAVGMGINDGGDVVGWLDTTGAFPAIQPFPILWSGGVLTILGSLPGGDAQARAINNAGLIVGVSTDFAGAAHAVVWQGGTIPAAISITGSLYSEANDVNESGSVAGMFAVPGADPTPIVTQAFVWKDGTPPQIKLLGTLAGAYMTQAYAINGKGDLVGLSYGPTAPHHATFWKADGSVLDLGTLGSSQSYAADINDLAEIVGEDGCDTEKFCGRGFLWRHGTMLDLNSLIPPGLGWTLHGATGISNSGYIVGVGTAPDGFEHGYLLRPLVSQTFP